MVNTRNLIQQAVTNTPGTGDFVLGAAVADFLALVAGDDGLTFTCTFTEVGLGQEVRTGCVYTHSTLALTRGTLEKSTTGSAISFTSAVVMSVTLPASVIDSFSEVAGVLGRDEVAITAGTTLTSAAFGRMHLCTGTSANYTVTLPAASGNAGKLIGFRMGNGFTLTKLVTLDGNASETIDGALARPMWSDEVAILLCDGANWFKIAGRSVPMTAAYFSVARIPASGSLATSTWTVVPFGFQTSGPASMFDGGNSRAVAARSGLMVCQFSCALNSTTNNASWSVAMAVNASSPTSQSMGGFTAPTGSANAVPYMPTTVAVAAGNYIVPMVYIVATTGYINTASAVMNLTEIPTW